MPGHTRILMDKKAIWGRFCTFHGVLDRGVPLFATDRELLVDTFEFGRKPSRMLLRRSSEMEERVLAEAGKIVEDFEAGPSGEKAGGGRYEGLIYVMYWLDRRQVVPLHLGTARKCGKDGRSLSSAIAGVERSRQRFCHWGDAYGSHVGDLSAAVLPGHAADKVKRRYRSWAERLFVQVPAASPRLVMPVHFWIKAWPAGSTGPWEDLGPTSLAFVESLLSGLAAAAYSDTLLDADVPRGP